MTEKDKAILQKINKYVEEIYTYIDGMTRDDFAEDRKTISATAFCIGQIGELVNDLTNEAKNANTQIPWQSIRGMRNRIIHDYEGLDLAVLWGTLKESLPELSEQIKPLLNDRNF